MIDASWSGKRRGLCICILGGLSAKGWQIAGECCYGPVKLTKLQIGILLWHQCANFNCRSCLHLLVSLAHISWKRTD
jgi:hypothetical protein